MKRVSYNSVIPNKIVGDYGQTVDTMGRVSYFTLDFCTVGAHKGKPVWTRIVARLVPATIVNKF